MRSLFIGAWTKLFGPGWYPTGDRVAEGVTGLSPALAEGAGATGTPAISQEDWFLETFTIPLLLYLILLFHSLGTDFVAPTK